MTYKEFIALAKEHYNEGGDCVVECWDKQAFNYYVEFFGPISKQDAIRIFDNYAHMEGY